MKIFKSFLGLITFLILSSSFSILFASENAVDFMRQASGARPQALGKAFVAISDDANATYWNPAGITQIDKDEITSMHTELFDLGIKLDFLSYVKKLKKNSGSVAITWSGLSVGDIPRTGVGFDTSGPEYRTILGYFGDTQNAYILSYAKELKEDVSFGINIKYIKHKLFNQDADGIGIDLGVLIKKDENLKFGVSFQNILPEGTKIKWSGGAEDKIPINFKLGVAYKIKNQNSKIKNLLLALDLDKTKNKDAVFHLGCEYSINENVKLRAGSDDGYGALGLGLNLSKYRLDYSYSVHTLGDISRISLSSKF